MLNYMKFIKNNYLSLVGWIALLLAISKITGFLTQSELKNWYLNINKSDLTPPNFVFPIVWTILYLFIATSGWIIWQSKEFCNLFLIKCLYITQLILNWSWSPLFFYYHLIQYSMGVSVAMTITVFTIIYLCRNQLKSVSMLMLPYFLWISFASYLNFYIWNNN